MGTPIISLFFYEFKIILITLQFIYKLRIKYWIFKQITKWITKKSLCYCIEIILNFKKTLQLKCIYLNCLSSKGFKKNTILVNFICMSYNVMLQSLNFYLFINRIMRLIEECFFTLLWRIINIRIKLNITIDSKFSFLSICLHSKTVTLKLILKYRNC